MVVGDLSTAVEVLVIGGGPGGYVAAIRAAQLGRQVTLVHDGPLGGTCLNAGCIPSKALLHATEQAARLPELAAMGVRVGPASVDFAAMQSWQRSVVAKLSGGVEQLLKSHGVDIEHGHAFFLNPKEVRVEGENGSLRYNFRYCIIATGAAPAPVEGALSPQAALALTAVPAAVHVVGNNYAAAELATLFARLGAAVTLDLAGGTLLSEFDPLAARFVQASLKKQGVHSGAAPASGATHIDASRQRPATQRLELAAAGLAAQADGSIAVDAQLRTSAGNIYAIGDVTGGPLLATVAIAQGKLAAEIISGQKSAYEPLAVPRVAHTDPEVAQVGIGPAAAQERGLRVKVGRYPLGASGRALTLGRAEGTAAVVADATSGVLLGAVIVGPRAGELISEAALAIEMGATLTDLSLTLHPHPSLAEALQEAADDALGLSVHQLKG